MKNYKVLVISEWTGKILKTLENLTLEEAQEIVKKNANENESWLIVKP